MSIDGLWTAETFGPFEWERAGVFVFENGRVAGGDDRQYAVGSYSLSDGHVKAEMLTRHYGPPRIVFGEAHDEFQVKITGLWDGDRIHGVIRRPDRPQFDLHIRLTRRKAFAAQADRRLGEAPAGAEAPANGALHEPLGAAMAVASPNRD
jgi:hypothetical protein